MEQKDREAVYSKKKQEKSRGNNKAESQSSERRDKQIKRQDEQIERG